MLSNEGLDQYWRDRWYLAERVHCLLKRMLELFDDIPKSEKPFSSVSRQKFFKFSSSIQNNALGSLRTIKKAYNQREKEPPAVEKGAETEEYREEFRKWLLSRKCSTPKECKTKGKCECPDLLSRYVIVSQVRLRW